MKKWICFLFLSLIYYSLSAQGYQTKSISSEIHTIQLLVNSNWSQRPIMKLNEGDNMIISFDRISDNSFNRLRYRIIHCNAYWIKSKDLSEIDYLDGFNDNLIEDYETSINTTVDYTHFNLSIPNAEVRLKISGNYVVEVYEEDNPHNILLTACFSVLDTKVNVGGTVSSNTDIDINRSHQQLLFTIHHPNINIRDPRTDLIVFAMQNNRLDTKRINLKPSYIGGAKLVYEHNKDLIFEAGNEYRRFETSSYRYNGMNVEHIEYKRPYYHMYLMTDKIRAGSAYSYDQDQNGRFIIRNAEKGNAENEADYFYTIFSLTSLNPLPYDIYINGDFTDDTFSETYKMKYDVRERIYYLPLLLKQGLYNYQYLTRDGKNYSTGKIEGNYYETENEYQIMVYHRPPGQRYDSLIGEQTIISRQK